MSHSTLEVKLEAIKSDQGKRETISIRTNMENKAAHQASMTEGAIACECIVREAQSMSECQG